MASRTPGITISEALTIQSNQHIASSRGAIDKAGYERITVNARGCGYLYPGLRRFQLENITAVSTGWTGSKVLEQPATFFNGTVLQPLGTFKSLQADGWALLDPAVVNLGALGPCGAVIVITMSRWPHSSKPERIGLCCFMPGGFTTITVSGLYLGIRAASGASKSNAAGSASAEKFIRNLQIPQTKASIMQQPRTRLRKGHSKFTMENLAAYEEHAMA